VGAAALDAAAAVVAALDAVAALVAAVAAVAALAPVAAAVAPLAAVAAVAAALPNENRAARLPPFLLRFPRFGLSLVLSNIRRTNSASYSISIHSDDILFNIDRSV
jgi:hypothetical protein